MTHWETSHPKANKPHTCSWCFDRIEKGEKYELQEGVEDNEHFRNKLHMECAKALQAIPPGDWEDYEELWGQAARGHLHEWYWGVEEKCPGCQDKLPQGIDYETGARLD